MLKRPQASIKNGSCLSCFRWKPPSPSPRSHWSSLSWFSTAILEIQNRMITTSPWQKNDQRFWEGGGCEAVELRDKHTHKTKNDGQVRSESPSSALATVGPCGHLVVGANGSRPPESFGIHYWVESLWSVLYFLSPMLKNFNFAVVLGQIWLVSCPSSIEPEDMKRHQLRPLVYSLTRRKVVLGYSAFSAQEPKATLGHKSHSWPQEPKPRPRFSWLRFS